MSETAPLLALYQLLWRGDGEDLWDQSDIAFTPFDDYAILRDGDLIAQHWRRRRAEWRLTALDFSPLANWHEKEIHIAVGRLTLTLRPGASPVSQKRDLRLVIAARGGDAGAWRLVHVAEAAEAALVAMISGYHAEATGRFRP